MPVAPDSIDTVLFDLDGTLVDNFKAIHRCYSEVAVHLGFPPLSYERVRASVGGSIPVTMRKLFPEEVADRAAALYRERFPAIMDDGLFVYEGVETLVRRLHERGYKVAVFTNKEITVTRRMLEHLGFDRLFHGVVGTGDTPWRKPQPEFTRHALEVLGSSPSRTIMIGDSPFDIAAARNGGLRAVHCVTTGSHSAEQLEHDKPDGIHAGMEELGRAVFGF